MPNSATASVSFSSAADKLAIRTSAIGMTSGAGAPKPVPSAAAVRNLAIRVGATSTIDLTGLVIKIRHRARPLRAGPLARSALQAKLRTARACCVLSAGQLHGRQEELT